MAQLIDKDALVAKIEKIMAKWFGVNNDFADGQKGALTDVLSLINTIEVKEVNIDKLCEFRKNVGFAYPECASEYQKQLACYCQRY